METPVIFQFKLILSISYRPCITRSKVLIAYFVSCLCSLGSIYRGSGGSQDR